MLDSDLFWELGVLLAIMSATLMITSELLSFYYGKVNILINRKRLYRSAWVTTFFFLAIIAIRILTVLFE